MKEQLASANNRNESDELRNLLMQFTNDSREMMACIATLEKENAELRGELGVPESAPAEGESTDTDTDIDTEPEVETEPDVTAEAADDADDAEAAIEIADDPSTEASSDNEESKSEEPTPA